MYTDGAEGSAVELITIKRGGHGWPANRVVARLAGLPPGIRSLADLLWHFFRQHRRAA